MKMIAEAWRTFESEVLPTDAPEVQRTETRRAFYAGARALFAGMVGMLEPGQDTTQADLGKMDAIQEELNQFREDVNEGRA